MQEDGSLVFIPPQKCITRIQEIQQEEHEVAFTFDPTGSVEMGKRAEELTCDTNGDINLRDAWTKRNLTFDQTVLAHFVVLEMRTTKLMLTKCREPSAGARCISTQQICECDKEMWMPLSQQSRGHLNVTDPDVFPQLIEQLTTSPEVLRFLSPLPGTKRESDSFLTTAPKQAKPLEMAVQVLLNQQATRRRRPIGEKCKQVVKVRGPMDESVWNINRDFATSKSSPNASSGSMNVSNVGPRPSKQCSTDMKHHLKSPPQTQAKLYLWNFSQGQAVLAEPCEKRASRSFQWITMQTDLHRRCQLSPLT